jgi:hypothetical protein
MYYDEAWSQANFTLGLNEIDFKQFEPFFKKALEERMK